MASEDSVMKLINFLSCNSKDENVIEIAAKLNQYLDDFPSGESILTALEYGQETDPAAALGQHWVNMEKELIQDPDRQVIVNFICWYHQHGLLGKHCKDNYDIIKYIFHRAKRSALEEAGASAKRAKITSSNASSVVTVESGEKPGDQQVPGGEAVPAETGTGGHGGDGSRDQLDPDGEADSEPHTGFYRFDFHEGIMTNTRDVLANTVTGYKEIDYFDYSVPLPTNEDNSTIIELTADEQGAIDLKTGRWTNKLFVSDRLFQIASYLMDNPIVNVDFRVPDDYDKDVTAFIYLLDNLAAFKFEKAGKPSIFMNSTKLAVLNWLDALNRGIPSKLYKAENGQLWIDHSDEVLQQIYDVKSWMGNDFARSNLENQKNTNFCIRTERVITHYLKDSVDFNPEQILDSIVAVKSSAALDSDDEGTVPTEVVNADAKPDESEMKKPDQFEAKPVESKQAKTTSTLDPSASKLVKADRSAAKTDDSKPNKSSSQHVATRSTNSVPTKPTPKPVRSKTDNPSEDKPVAKPATVSTKVDEIPLPSDSDKDDYQAATMLSATRSNDVPKPKKADQNPTPTTRSQARKPKTNRDKKKTMNAVLTSDPNSPYVFQIPEHPSKDRSDKSVENYRLIFRYYHDEPHEFDFFLNVSFPHLEGNINPNHDKAEENKGRHQEMYKEIVSATTNYIEHIVKQTGNIGLKDVPADILQEMKYIQELGIHIFQTMCANGTFAEYVNMNNKSGKIKSINRTSVQMVSEDLYNWKQAFRRKLWQSNYLSIAENYRAALLDRSKSEEDQRSEFQKALKKQLDFKNQQGVAVWFRFFLCQHLHGLAICLRADGIKITKTSNGDLAFKYH